MPIPEFLKPGAVPLMLTFTAIFPVDTTLGWELYKTNLREELFNRAAAQPGCPEEIVNSAYTGTVRVSTTQLEVSFMVTLTQGEAT